MATYRRKSEAESLPLTPECLDLSHASPISLTMLLFYIMCMNDLSPCLYVHQVQNRSLDPLELEL